MGAGDTKIVNETLAFGLAPGEPRLSHPCCATARRYHESFVCGQMTQRQLAATTINNVENNRIRGRDVANLNGPRTKQGYRVTAQIIKSYYILGSTTKLASWTAPGVTFLVAR